MRPDPVPRIPRSTSDAEAPEARSIGRPALAAGRFLVLGNIDLQRSDYHVTCRIELARGARSLLGEARELDSEAGRARAAARATLIAAEQAGDGAHLSLEGAILIDLFGRRYAVVSVEAISSRVLTHLTGIVAVERSVEEAACLATLGAVERWLSV